MEDAGFGKTRALGIPQGADGIIFLACLAPVDLGSTAEE